MRKFNTLSILLPQLEYGAHIEKWYDPTYYCGRNLMRYREPVTGEVVAHGTRLVVAVRILLVPYLIASRADGTEVLLHREYQAIWERKPGGPAVRSAANAIWTGGTFLYNDGTPEDEKLARGRRVLADWGIPLPAKLADLVRLS